MRIKTASVFAALALAAPGLAQQPRVQRAMVLEFVNATRDRHTVMLRPDTDVLSLYLKRTGAYEIVARQEVERTAKQQGILLPLNVEDATRLAKAMDVSLLVTGEVREIDARNRGSQRVVEV